MSEKKQELCVNCCQNSPLYAAGCTLLYVDECDPENCSFYLTGDQLRESARNAARHFDGTPAQYFHSQPEPVKKRLKQYGINAMTIGGR